MQRLNRFSRDCAGTVRPIQLGRAPPRPRGRVGCAPTPAARLTCGRTNTGCAPDLRAHPHRHAPTRARARKHQNSPRSHRLKRTGAVLVLSPPESPRLPERQRGWGSFGCCGVRTRACAPKHRVRRQARAGGPAPSARVARGPARSALGRSVGQACACWPRRSAGAHRR